MTNTPTSGLIADIGGTNIRLACVDTDRAKPRIHSVLEMTYTELDSVEEAISHYLHDKKLPVCPPRVVFAVAGAIDDGRVQLTNAHWHIDAADLVRSFNLQSAHLINDFEALALALPHLAKDDLVSIGPDLMPSSEKPQTYLVMGPGTGLGVAALHRGMDADCVLPTEAGHVGLSPVTEEDRALMAYLQRKYGRASNERVLCGDGLLDLYRFWCERLGERLEARAPKDVTPLADVGSKAANAALDQFMHILGSVAGDMALAFKATGGVFLAGGILPKLSARLIHSSFRRDFEAHPPYTDLLTRIPTALITRDNPALLGCAEFLHSQISADARTIV